MLTYFISESDIQYGLFDFISKAAVIWSFVTVKTQIVTSQRQAWQES